MVGPLHEIASSTLTSSLAVGGSGSRRRSGEVGARVLASAASEANDDSAHVDSAVAWVPRCQQENLNATWASSHKYAKSGWWLSSKDAHWGYREHQGAMLTVGRTNRFVVAAGRAAEISAGAVSRPRISQKRMFRGVSLDCNPPRRGGRAGGYSGIFPVDVVGQLRFRVGHLAFLLSPDLLLLLGSRTRS